MILSSPCRKDAVYISPFSSLCNLLSSAVVLLGDVTSLAKLRSGEVWGGWATAGVSDSSTFSSITPAGVSFMSTSSGRVSEEATVSGGGGSTDVDLKKQKVALRKDGWSQSKDRPVD